MQAQALGYLGLRFFTLNHQPSAISRITEGWTPSSARRGMISMIALLSLISGRPIAGMDAQGAAIANVHVALLATRNTADFEGCGLRLVNPWVD